MGVGAPWLPVRRRDIIDAFALVNVGPSDTVIDLGSGDGRLLVAAAEKGARVIGYELNPFLVWWSKRALSRFGARATVVRKDLRTVNLSEATVVFIFGITDLMPKITEMVRRDGCSGLMIVSFAFALPGFTSVAERGIVRVYRKEGERK